MGASASLDRAALVVDPGNEVTAQLSVRNNGNVVDEFTFEALGPGAAWIEVVPAAVPLFPGVDATVTVRFAPPRTASTAPGDMPFGIKVKSREDAAGSTVEEGVITVGRFAERNVEMFPVTARGRRKARYEIAVDNRGNAPIQVQLSGSDPENACRYQFASPSITIQPGEASFSKLHVVPAKKFWKGPPKSHQFQTVVAEAEGPPSITNGTMLQESMLPPWFLKALLAILGLILLLWILWQTLFKPTVESTARDAIAAPLATITSIADQLVPTTVVDGGGGAPTPTEPGGDGDGGGGPTTVPATAPTTTAAAPTTVAPSTTIPPTTVPGTTLLTPFGNPSDFQLAGNIADNATQSFAKPFTAEFSLTDFVLQNPAGDTGRIQIKRDGAVLFTSALENFRDLDLHFVAPYVFKPGQQLVMTVVCDTPAAGANCAVSASFAGFSK